MTDDEWSCLAPHLPQPRSGGRPRVHPRREILNAIFYVLRSVCAWCLLPHDLPPWKPCTTISTSGGCRALGSIHTALREAIRVHAGRDPQPSAAIMDSQLVKTTAVGGVRGYDGAKQLSGRKWHLLVDPGVGLAGQGPQCRCPGLGRHLLGVGGNPRGVPTAGACLG